MLTTVASPAVRASVDEALRGLEFDGLYFATTDPSSGMVDGSWSWGDPCGVELTFDLTAQGVCWGHLTLFRHKDFSRCERAEARRAAGELTSVLMRRMLGIPLGRVAADSLGMINLDEHGAVESVNSYGMEFLASERCLVALRSVRAALLRGAPRGVMLLADEDLGWLQLHGTLQWGSGRRCFLTLQAARPLQVAPILLAARGATPRAVQVTLRVLRGMTSAEIASELRISPHTVQDHLKPVFTALEVNSRRQLISSLFPDLKPYDLC